MGGVGVMPIAVMIGKLNTQGGKDVDKQHAIVAATINTMRTRVDGTLTVTLEIEPRHVGQWIQSFGTMPGTPVAVARLTNEAINQAAAQPKADWGEVYQSLYTVGWFNNPRVKSAFGLPFNAHNRLEDNAEEIKSLIYGHFGVQSLKQLDPKLFAEFCAEIGILAKDMPPNFRELSGDGPKGCE